MGRTLKLTTMWLFLLILFGGPPCWADLHVYTQSSSEIKSLDLHQLQNLYLGRTKFINEIPVMLSDHLPHQKDFIKRVLHKNHTQYQSLWRMRTFTGKGKAPLKISNAHDLEKAYHDYPNLIVYAPSELDRSRWTRLLSIPLLQ